MAAGACTQHVRWAEAGKRVQARLQRADSGREGRACVSNRTSSEHARGGVLGRRLRADACSGAGGDRACSSVGQAQQVKVREWGGARGQIASRCSRCRGWRPASRREARGRKGGEGATATEERRQRRRASSANRVYCTAGKGAHQGGGNSPAAVVAMAAGPGQRRRADLERSGARRGAEAGYGGGDGATQDSDAHTGNVCGHAGQQGAGQ